MDRIKNPELKKRVFFSPSEKDGRRSCSGRRNGRQPANQEVSYCVLFCRSDSSCVCVLYLVGGLCGDGEGRFAADCTTTGADLLSAPDKTGFLTCQMFRHLSKVFVVDTLKHTSSTIKPHTSVVAVKEFCKDLHNYHFTNLDFFFHKTVLLTSHRLKCPERGRRLWNSNDL